MNIQMTDELSSLSELVVRVSNSHRDSGAYSTHGIPAVRGVTEAPSASII